MILLHRYQQSARPRRSALRRSLGTQTRTNAGAEGTDSDAQALSGTQTVTETKQEHADTDWRTAAGTATGTLVASEQPDSDPRAICYYPIPR